MDVRVPEMASLTREQVHNGALLLMFLHVVIGDEGGSCLLPIPLSNSQIGLVHS